MQRLLRMMFVGICLQAFLAGCQGEPAKVDAPPPPATEQQQMDQVGKVPGA